YAEPHLGSEQLRTPRREIDPDFAHGVHHDRMHTVRRMRTGGKRPPLRRVYQTVEHRRGHLRSTRVMDAREEDGSHPLVARMNALATLPSTSGASASTSSPASVRN